MRPAKTILLEIDGPNWLRILGCGSEQQPRGYHTADAHQCKHHGTSRASYRLRQEHRMNLGNSRNCIAIRSGARLEPEEVAEEGKARASEHRLRVKLHAFDAEFTV